MASMLVFSMITIILLYRGFIKPHYLETIYWEVYYYVSIYFRVDHNLGNLEVDTRCVKFLRSVGTCVRIVPLLLHSYQFLEVAIYTFLLFLYRR